MTTGLRILHVTPGLESGGAETVLADLVTHAACSEHLVVSLTDEGPLLGARLRAAGIAVRALGGRRGVPNPGLALSLARLIRRERPDVVQTWLYHGDLVGGLAARLAGGIPVVWGIHSTELIAGKTSRLTRAVIALNALLSRVLPTRIACCSDAARAFHIGQGYPAGKMTTIRNGVDTDRFAPDPAARHALRAELGLPPDTPLVGLMARFHAQKDHRTFLRAAGRLHAARPNVHFVLCGTGVTPQNAELAGWVAENGIASVTHCLGLRPDAPRINAALDSASSSSAFGEAFPVALCEAMACGVPVVTTNLPGSVEAAGEEGGRVVPVGDDAAMAAAWQEILSLPANERERLAEGCRRRALGFSVERMTRNYEGLYTQASGVAEGAVTCG